MDRLIATNSVPFANADTAPATGTAQYATSGNPVTNTPATIFPAYAWNMLQDEIYNVIIAAGLTPNRNAWNQLLTAIQSMLQGGTTNVGVDTGAANAYVVAFTPALPNPVPWVPFWFEVKTTNTGASTLNATGTVEPLVGGAHLALQGGEMVAKGNALVYWNPTLNSNAGAYVLLFCSGAPEQIAPATQSEHAMQLGQATGRLLRTSVYTNVGGTQFVSVNGGAATSTGASTFTPLALTNAVDIEVLGGGGAGGGAIATGSTTCSCGSGGNDGCYGRGFYTSGFSSLAITVGGAGTAVSGATGGTGGSSSAGALLSVAGGAGGFASAASAPPIFAGAQTPAGVVSGANVISSVSTPGGFGFGFNTGTLIGGTGAPGPFGGAGNSGVSAPGSAAQGPGAGGGGSVNTVSQAAKSAGAGGAGLVIIREYQ